MSAPNFYTMDDFPLFVRDFTEDTKRCTCCRLIQDPANEVCEDCGDELEDYLYYDDFEAEHVCKAVEDDMDDINRDLLFHRLSLRSGYYTGVQFYVDVEHDLDAYEYDNEDCHYYFDCCRSEAIRKFHRESNKVNRMLKQLAKMHGFEQLVCTAIMSNGEAMYARVNAENPRERLIAAATAA